MIKHFDKIENLGVFAKYLKPAGMVPFAKFNLIYGLNGSGKTTLSRFFFDLNSGTAPGFEDLKYKINTTEGSFKEGQPYTRKIRVFNSEYVEANIGELEGRLNPIFVIGEESKTLVGIVKQDEAALKRAEEALKEKSDVKEKLIKERGKIFTKIAGEITTHIAGTTTRTYRKNNAETAFSKLTDPQILSTEELASTSQSMTQNAMDEQVEISLGSINLLARDKTEVPYFTALQMMEEHISGIVQTSATSIPIQRLVENHSIAQWVEQGVSVHKHAAGDNCEFCQQKIPQERLELLASHFNDSDRKLKEELNQLSQDLDALHQNLKEFSLPDKSNFYAEFQEPFVTAVGKLPSLKTALLNHLDELTKILKAKLTRRTVSYTVDVSVFNATPYLDVIQEVNGLIDQNNVQTKKFDQRLQAARSKVEKHFLSRIRDEVAEIDGKIVATEHSIAEINEGDIEKGTLGIDALKESIRNNRIQISNSHKAAEDLSIKLASFLGRDDLRFESENEGYRIMRLGRAAKRLSEGEKTAITFLYFVVGLKDQDFNISEGIVVIDDPISSLDSSSVYQAFAFLKNAVRDARQIFLLTHNFEFLKLLLDWMSHGGKKDKTYWMLHCTVTDGTNRETELKPLDKILLENKNELTYPRQSLERMVDSQTFICVIHSRPLFHEVLRCRLLPFSITFPLWMIRASIGKFCIRFRKFCCWFYAGRWPERMILLRSGIGVSRSWSS